MKAGTTKHLLYSADETGKDDGGNPSTEKAPNFQISPGKTPCTGLGPVAAATKEEIQNYYAHPPK